MANGTYGIKMPANITSDDCEIFYFYRPSRSTDDPDFKEFKKLDSRMLTSMNCSNIDGTKGIMPGMYDLRLPVDIFGKVGIYNIYIKPTEIYLNILDISTLSSYPNVRGVVIDASNLPESLKKNGALVGYRIEYFDNGNRTDTFRIITSNNKCEPVSNGINSSYGKDVRYIFNDNSSIMFCTVTPSTEMSFNTVASNPFIGKATQRIALVNTKFNPFMMEVEMVKHDIETVSTMLEGNQIRNLDTGLITTFNDDGEIYHQASYGNVVNATEGVNHDFKLKNEGVIDTSEESNFRKITENI